MKYNQIMIFILGIASTQINTVFAMQTGANIRAAVTIPSKFDEELTAMPYREEDKNALMALNQKLQAYNAAFFASSILRPGQFNADDNTENLRWVIKKDDTIIGLIGCFLHPDRRLKFDNFLLAPEYKKQGFYDKLLAFVESKGRERTAKQVRTDVPTGVTGHQGSDHLSADTINTYYKALANRNYYLVTIFNAPRPLYTSFVKELE